MRIGRYRICWNRHFRFQTQPLIVVIVKFLSFIIWRDVKPTDVDKTPLFPEGTKLKYKDGEYTYFRADKNYKKNEVVFKP